MNLTFDLLELAQTVFSQICDKYNLTVCRTGNCKVALRSENYIIIIGVDFDGVFMNYFNHGQESGFDLISFLLDERRSKLSFSEEDASISTHRDYVKSHLEALAKHLVEGGEDILAGEVDWKKMYRSPNIRLAVDDRIR